MALRFSSKSAAVAVAGTSFALDLKVAGAAVAPTEWAVNHRGAPPAGSPPAYVVSVSTSAIVVAASSGATTCDVFASYAHSSIS